jgi:hypothetical protein
MSEHCKHQLPYTACRLRRRNPRFKFAAYFRSPFVIMKRKFAIFRNVLLLFRVEENKGRGKERGKWREGDIRNGKQKTTAQVIFQDPLSVCLPL